MGLSAIMILDVLIVFTLRVALYHLFLVAWFIWRLCLQNASKSPSRSCDSVNILLQENLRLLYGIPFRFWKMIRVELGGLVVMMFG